MKPPLLAGGLFAAAFVASCFLGAVLPLAPLPVQPLWLAAGILAGALVRLPPRHWPHPIAIALIAGSAFRIVWSADGLGLSAGLAAAQIVACALTALAYRALRGSGAAGPVVVDFSQTRPVVEFFTVVCALGAILHASFGAVVLAAAPEVGASGYVWAQWQVAHLLGIALLSPLWLLADSEWRTLRRELTPARIAEGAVALALLLAALVHVYWTLPTGTPRAYIVLPPLLWLTLRFRVPGAVIGMIVASVAAIAATNAGLGLYAGTPPERVATGLPGLLTVGSFCFISLGAAVTQVRRTSSDLDELNRSLAAEVAKQTSSLTTAMTRLRLAVDGAGIGTWQWTVGTTQTSVDDRQREILGLAPGEAMTADAAFSRIDPEDVVSLRSDFERWIREGGAWVYEHRVRDPDGRIRWVAGRAALIREPDGRAVATGVTFDITRQKLEERGRRRAERQVRQLADCAPATLWATDREGQTTFRSRDWHGLTGQPAESGLGLAWLDRVHDDDREQVWKRLLEAHARRTSFSAEYRVRAADGATLWVLDNGRPFVSDDGVFQGLVGSVVDITELRKVSEELRESDERFRQLADHLDAGFWIAEIARPTGATGLYDSDQSVHVRYVSSGYRRIWNVEEGPLEGRTATWVALIHPDDRQSTFDAFRAFLDDAGDYNVEYRLLPPTGRLHWIHERAYAASRDEQGRITLVTGLTIDATERHAAEEALRDADRQKDTFLAMLAHELRNPLAPIRTATHVLAAPGVDAAVRGQACEIIERQVVHITRLVDDLLDVSRLSRGRLELQRVPVDLVLVVRETVADYARFLSEARLAIELDVPDEATWVNGDATRLAQVLGNLLHNVRKFTPPGGAVRVSLDRADAGTARLRVRDTGDGIPADLLPRIFEPFSQRGQTLDRSAGGLGLGLSLVKGLVEVHDGTVTVESGGHGRGTLFEIRLPLAAAPGPTVAGASAVPPAGALMVLIVEDNRDAAETLRLLLAIEGHQVAVAHTAREGIELARQLSPDLVLCDIGLPGDMSGLDLARALHGHGRRPRLVALTGYAGAEHIRAADAAGFDRHVTKPVGVAELRQLLAETKHARLGASAG